MNSKPITCNKMECRMIRCIKWASMLREQHACRSHPHNLEQVNVPDCRKLGPSDVSCLLDESLQSPLVLLGAAGKPRCDAVCDSIHSAPVEVNQQVLWQTGSPQFRRKKRCCCAFSMMVDVCAAQERSSVMVTPRN